MFIKERKYREIGGEFWCVPTQPHIREGMFVPLWAQWYLSGRTALRAIIKELSWAKTVALPSWCCDSMVTPFLDVGISVRFYPVYAENGLIQEIDNQCDVLLLMDYFGYTTSLTAEHSCVIRDVTHSLFSTSYNDAHYFFGSLRKWCGVWTGGFAWKSNGQLLDEVESDESKYTVLREKAMILKKHYIEQCLDEGKDTIDKNFLGHFEDAEYVLDNCGIAPADERDKTLIEKIDVEYIKTRRRLNADVLMNAFPDLLIFPKLADNDCPMFVPIIVPDGRRNDLRQHLIDHEIYCPVHWQVQGSYRLSDKTKILIDNGLSLVCDQRYTEEDMNRIVCTVMQFLQEGIQ